MGSVSYGLGADLSPSLPVGDDRYLNLSSQKRPTKSRGKSFGTTLWHHVQRYCCLGVLFAHAQVHSNSSSYHIRGNDMDCLGDFPSIMRSTRGSAPTLTRLGCQLLPLDHCFSRPVPWLSHFARSKDTSHAPHCPFIRGKLDNNCFEP